MRDATTRKAFVLGELAAMRVPNLELLAEPAPFVALTQVAQRWRDSRIDVSIALRRTIASISRGSCRCWVFATRR